MAFVPVANICEVFMEHTYLDKPGIGWVLHYETTMAPWTVAMMNDLGGELVNWWTIEMRPLITNLGQLVRVRMRDLTSQNGTIADYSLGLPVIGTRSGLGMPSNVSLSIKKNTGLAGKSFRGRMYAFGMAEGDVSGNVVDTTYANNLVAAWDEALAFIGAVATYGMVVASKYSGGQPRVVGLATPISSISLADYRVDTRRDRL